MTFFLLDGGVGRELHRRGAPFRQPEWSALALWKQPTAVLDVHLSYLQAGADLITPNSYALVPYHLGEETFAQHGLTLCRLAGQLAQSARDSYWTAYQLDQANKHQLDEPGSLVTAPFARKRGKPRVLGSIPPLFGSYNADYYYQNAKQPGRVAQVATPLILGQDPYVDLWVLETQSNSAEPLAVLQLLQDLTPGHKDVWVSFNLYDYQALGDYTTFDDTASGSACSCYQQQKSAQTSTSSKNTNQAPRLAGGELLSDVLDKVAKHPAVKAVLFNCCRPELVDSALALVDQWRKQHKPQLLTGAFANAFTAAFASNEANSGLDEFRSDLDVANYVSRARVWRNQYGANLIGGCCGIGPEYISALAQEFANEEAV